MDGNDEETIYMTAPGGSKKTIPPVPRKELAELMQRYAQMRRIPYNESWRELSCRFKKKHHVAIYYMKHSYCEDHHTDLTLPAFLEETHWMAEALEIARAMIVAPQKQKEDPP